MGTIDEDGYRAWQLLMRFFFAQREYLPSWADQFGLSPVQCHVLHLIDPDQPVPMRRLADLLSCDASNVTGLVDRLESRGLVRRRPSPDDRRVKVLDLTAHGSRIRAEMLRRMTSAPRPLGRLTRQERRTLSRILTKLIEGDDDRQP